MECNGSRDLSSLFLAATTLSFPASRRVTPFVAWFDFAPPTISLRLWPLPINGLQAVAIGAPSAFDAAVPELLAYIYGPTVRGKKERITEWLESRQTQRGEQVSD